MKKSLFALSLIGAFGLSTPLATAGPLSKSGRAIGNKQSSSRSASRASRGGSSRASRASRNSNSRGGRAGGRANRGRRGGFVGRGFRGGFGGAFLGSGFWYTHPYYYGYRGPNCFDCGVNAGYAAPPQPTKKIFRRVQIDASIQRIRDDETGTVSPAASHFAFEMASAFVGVRVQADRYRERVFDDTREQTNTFDLWSAGLTGRVIQSPRFALDIQGGLGGYDSNLLDHLTGPQIGAAVRFSVTPDIELSARTTGFFFPESETGGDGSVTVSDSVIGVRASILWLGYREMVVDVEGSSEPAKVRGPEVGVSLQF